MLQGPPEPSAAQPARRLVTDRPEMESSSRHASHAAGAFNGWGARRGVEAVEGQGELRGLVLAPGEDPVRAWARLPAGTEAAYVRFPRGGDLPLAAVQRLARRGHVVVDAAPRDAGDVLDLAVAGASGVVAWLGDGGDLRAMADAMGEGFLVGCTAADVAEGAALAGELEVPLLLAGAEPPAGARGYRVELGESSVVLRRFGVWPEPHEPEVPGAMSDEGDAEERTEEA
jgi:hypothetical protein